MSLSRADVEKVSLLGRLLLSDAELDDKFLELAAPVIGAERARVLLRNIWSLDKAEGLQALTA